MTPPPPAAAAARTAPAVHPRRAPLAPARRPRRRSGPLPRPSVARPAPARRAASPASALISHPLLDRLIHGRAWIGIVAFALIGIVTMQLGLLKLNAGIGRALEHETALQRENSALSVENSEVAAGDTVELQAAHMGMQLIPAGALRFLSAQGSTGDIARAVAALKVRVDGTSTTSSATSTSTSTPSSTEAEASATSATPASSSTESTSAPVATPTSSTAPETAENTTAQGTGTGTDTGAASAGAPAASTGAAGESDAGAPSSTAAPAGEAGGAPASPQG